MSATLRDHIRALPHYYGPDAVSRFAVLALLDGGVETPARHELASALHQAAEWFQEYAGIHDRKGDEEKSRRNQDRANFCLAALLGRTAPQPIAEPRTADPPPAEKYVVRDDRLRRYMGPTVPYVGDIKKALVMSKEEAEYQVRSHKYLRQLSIIPVPAAPRGPSERAHGADMTTEKHDAEHPAGDETAAIRMELEAETKRRRFMQVTGRWMVWGYDDKAKRAFVKVHDDSVWGPYSGAELAIAYHDGDVPKAEREAIDAAIIEHDRIWAEYNEERAARIADIRAEIAAHAKRRLSAANHD